MGLQQGLFSPDRVVEGHRRLPDSGNIPRQRLLIDNLGAALAHDLGQAGFLQGEGFPAVKFSQLLGGIKGRIIRPLGQISEGDGLPAAGIGNVRLNTSQGRLGIRRESREVEALLQVIVILHAEAGRATGVGPAINPVRAFAVFESEAVINRGGDRRATGGRVGKQWEGGAGLGDLGVAGLAIRLQRRRQGSEGHGRLGRGAGDLVIDQRIGRIRPQHLKRTHRRPGRHGLGVLDQDERLGAGDGVEVIPQGIGVALHHQGMLFIGIIAGQGRVILNVNTAICLLGGEARILHSSA